MSKLAIYLCAILFASAVEASKISSSPEAAPRRVEAIVDAALRRVKMLQQTAKLKTKIINRKLREGEFDDKFADSIMEMNNEIASNTRELEHMNVSTTDCERLTSNLQNKIHDVLLTTESCSSETTEAVRADSKNINMLFVKVGEVFARLKKTALRCGKHDDGVKSTNRDLLCAETTVPKVTEIVAKNVESLQTKVNEMSKWFSGPPEASISCSKNDELVLFKDEALSIGSQMLRCTEQKINEARRTKSEVGKTNEHR